MCPTDRGRSLLAMQLSTVESIPLSRILAKLGVRSRVEAATSAHRLGLAATSAPGHGGRG
jgi:hypothetical protein